jgi:hypothetical protein
MTNRRGPGNEQLTELDWTGSSMSNWHTNVYAASGLVGTYSPNLDSYTSGQQPTVLNFYLTDWLGRRHASRGAFAERVHRTVQAAI